MTRPFLLFPLGLLMLSAPLQALDLAMPYPVLGLTAEPAEHDSYDLPVAVWSGSTVPVERFEGIKERRAFRLDAAGASLLDVAGPLRDQLLAQGYQLRLDCPARECGGFDFRFVTEIMAEPAMHVDLADYRFVAASRGGEAVSLMVSRSAQSAFVQVIAVGAEALPPATVNEPERPVAPAPVEALPAETVDSMSARLDQGLSVALDDLVFASGASALSEGEYVSLQALADWLAADSARSLILVGHTDVSGGLAQNVALSRKRAEAVRQVLIRQFGVAAARLGAEGVGPLAPRAGNDSDAGRTRNRRVEAVPAPT